MLRSLWTRFTQVPEGADLFDRLLLYLLYFVSALIAFMGLLSLAAALTGGIDLAVRLALVGFAAGFFLVAYAARIFFYQLFALRIRFRIR